MLTIFAGIVLRTSQYLPEEENETSNRTAMAMLLITTQGMILLIFVYQVSGNLEHGCV